MKLYNKAILRPADKPEGPDACSVSFHKGKRQDPADFFRRLDDEAEVNGKMVVMGPAVRVTANEDGSLAEAELILDPADWREDEEFATPGDRRLEDAVDFIFCYFFGTDHGQDKPKVEASKARLRKRLREKLRLDVLEDASSDLDVALDHLEKTLYLMDTYLLRFPAQLAGSEFTEQMEELSDYLEDWGMGKQPPSTRPQVENPMSEGSILGEIIRREVDG